MYSRADVAFKSPMIDQLLAQGTTNVYAVHAVAKCAQTQQRQSGQYRGETMCNRALIERLHPSCRINIWCLVSVAGHRDKDLYIEQKSRLSKADSNRCMSVDLHLD